TACAVVDIILLVEMSAVRWSEPPARPPRRAPNFIGRKRATLMAMSTLFESSDLSAAGGAPLNGLVLCGGRGTRLGRDKGSLDYHGRPQAQWLFELLRGFCAEVFVSVRADQAGGDVYRGLPAFAEPRGAEGPAAGLRAAWQRAPASAWLVVAADLPLVDARTLRARVDARDPLANATAFRHPDGTPEPLCA